MALGLIAILLGGCGSAAKQPAGAVLAGSPRPSRGVIDDPRDSHLSCLKDAGLDAQKVGLTGLQFSPPRGAAVDFLPTPGAAQQAAISGQAQAAEVIGAALVYPNSATDGDLQKIEDCLAVGVKG